MARFRYSAKARPNVPVGSAALWSQYENVRGSAAGLAVTFFVTVRLFRWE